MRFVVGRQMPFPDKAGLIAPRLQALRECHRLQFKMRTVFLALQRSVFDFADIIVDESRGRRELAGHDRCPRRSADRTGGIGVGEAHALLGQLVEVGGLKHLVAVTTQVPPAHVVDEDEEYVGRRCGRSFIVDGRNPRILCPRKRAEPQHQIQDPFLHALCLHRTIEIRLDILRPQSCLYHCPSISAKIFFIALRTSV